LLRIAVSQEVAVRKSLAFVLLVAFTPIAAAQTRSAPRRLAENRQPRPVAAAAEGTLRRNHDAKPGEAPYALLDKQGRVAFFVQPDPGVSLAQHVGRRVKLAGAKALAPGQRTPVFAAQAVEPAVKSEVAHAPFNAETAEAEVALASHQEVLPAPMEMEADETGEPYYEGPVEGEVIEQGHAPLGREAFHPHDDCNLCGGYGCDACGSPGTCVGGLYGRAEYLYWWTDGMYTPALVSTSPNGTTRENAGVLGVPGTEVLFGRDGLNDEGRSGGRLSLGYWFDGGHCHAVEGDYWALGDGDDDFFASSPGVPILARPFYDVLEGTESSQLVAFPDVLSGSVTVDSETRLQGAGLRKRWNICGTDWCDPCDGYGWRYDVTAGYRFMRLDDHLSVREDLTSTDTANPGSFVVFDQFRTKNVFHGGEVGAVFEGRHGRWSYEFLGRLAIGGTRSNVSINGFTDITEVNGGTVRYRGGLLSQRTNIGEYERQSLAVVPEIGATVGLQLTSVWRLTCGYTFLYWSNVARSGHQIDRDINPNLLAPEATPFAGPLRPEFQFNDTDFWAMGLNVGLDARW
jgi:hypothetical protein